jgi:hypothetical protein
VQRYLIGYEHSFVNSAAAASETLMITAILALIAALAVPFAWGWLVHWLFYRLHLSNRLAKVPHESGEAVNSDNWDYQI